ncbi:MAG TPA: BPSS1780 family membrane protein [Pseudoxanthomonas sp.]|jgi:hypothetical protein|nr:BPSS1780 family membrane protein [Pseudoxanthomonas sp.]
MSTINKVPATAGAVWLLAGFTLLRKAPLRLGMLVVYWSLAANVVLALAALTGSATLVVAVQLIVTLSSPLFVGGLIWTMREVEADRPASVQALLQPIRDGRGPALLKAMLLPQLALLVLMVVLLFAMIGLQEMQRVADVYQQLQTIAAAGGQPDPALMQDLPAGRLLLWLLLVIVSAIAAAWMSFIAAPQVLFQGADALSAVRTSLNACVHNWSAMLLFYVLAGIAFFGIMMILFFFATVLQFVLGAGFALALFQLALNIIVLPAMAGAMLVAWRQMLPSAEGAAPPSATSAPSHIEV